MNTSNLISRNRTREECIGELISRKCHMASHKITASCINVQQVKARLGAVLLSTDLAFASCAVDLSLAWTRLSFDLAAYGSPILHCFSSWISSTRINPCANLLLAKPGMNKIWRSKATNPVLLDPLPGSWIKYGYHPSLIYSRDAETLQGLIKSYINAVVSA